MQIILAIATSKRPDYVQETLARFAMQTPCAQKILVVGADPCDAPSCLYGAEFHVCPTRGSAHQRNFALDLVGEGDNVIVFVDDDFVPAPGFIAGVERLFADHEDVVAASGHLIADGACSAGYTFAQADALIADYRPPAYNSMSDETGTYGCNMAFRIAAAPKVRFDENLPLYAWLEDTDFSACYARVGRVVRARHFAGVHLGVKSGRVSGLRLGYLQISNPIYLTNKGTVKRMFAAKLAMRNIIANCVKSFAPEPWVDRRGRLRGNILALGDWLSGRLSPNRVLEL